MFGGKYMMSFISIVTSLSLMTNAAHFHVSAETDIYSALVETHEENKSSIYSSGNITYREYTEKYSNEKYTEDILSLSLIRREDDSFLYEVNILWSGLYCAEISYLPVISPSAEIELSMEIDGNIPFDSAQRLRLNKVYKAAKAIQKDRNGNEIRSAQEQVEIQQKTDLNDPDGLQNDPLVFYFEKGRHTVKLDVQRGSIDIEYIKLHCPEKYKTYEEYIAGINACVSPDDTPSALVRIEGENAKYKSSPVLYPTYDNSSCDVSPSDPWHLIYNTIGNGSYKKSGQTLTWEFTVPNDGWYKIGIKARQEEMRGFFSNRRLYIDGEVPCEDMSAVRFNYSTDFELNEVKTEDGDDIYIYLTAGETHTLTMEAVPGVIGSYIQQLGDIVYELNENYRRIAMITGTQPDKYTDYYVHEKIPGLTDSFEIISGQLRMIKSDIELLSGSEGSEAASLENMAVILEKCIQSPIRIPAYLSQIKDCTAAISSWMRDYRDQPLEIDYIELASKSSDFSDTKAGFFSRIAYSFKRFLSSFIKDDNNIDNSDGIEVWVQLGREQAQVVRELTESEFITETGIPVSVKLVSGGIVEAALADEEPNAALFLSGETPVNLGSRGLLEDISEFQGFEQISQMYTNNAFVPYTYNDDIYAVPLVRSWAVMFCRMDILSGLGITSPPETWQELIDILPILQRNYMSAGLVLPGAKSVSGGTALASSVTETGHTFAVLMLQNGMNYYNASKTGTTFYTNEAISAFEQWTSFYTKYSLPQQYDAFSRFRTGDYPIVIADYTFCNQLSTAAPEINGLWDFTSVPGTQLADGSISHTVNSVGSGAVIFKNNDRKKTEAAWEYIKWFCSSEVQTKYAQQTEGLMGQLGRYAPANTETLRQMQWSAKELDVLESTMLQTEEIPILPSSYAVTRNIMNAFRDVVNNGENPRDALMRYDRDINKEMARKN